MRALVRDALSSREEVLKKDIACNPHRVAANVLQARALEAHGDLVLSGFGKELIGVLEKVVARGGFSKATKIAGIVNDVVTSNSAGEFAEKRLKRIASGKLPDNAAAKKAFREAYKSLRQQLIGTHTETVMTSDRSSTTYCPQGTETLHVSLDPGASTVKVELHAVDCCRVGATAAEPREYHAVIHGHVFVIEKGDDDVDWIFTNRGSDFWGFCCDDGSKDALLDQKFDQLFNPAAMAAHQREQCGEKKDDRCAGVNCDELMQKIKAFDEEIAVLDAAITALQKRLDALVKANPQALGELGEAADLQHQVDVELIPERLPLLKAMSSLIAEWLDCCSDRAVDELMQGIIAHYVQRLEDMINDNRTSVVFPQHPAGEFVNLTPFPPNTLGLDMPVRCPDPLDANDTLLLIVPDSPPPVEFMPSDHIFLLEPLPAPHGALDREAQQGSNMDGFGAGGTILAIDGIRGVYLDTAPLAHPLR